MVADDDALRRLIQGLSREVLEGHVKNLRDHNGLRQLVASGAIDQREVNEAYRSYAREVSGEYGRRITDLSVRYYAELLEVGNEYSRHFYERVTNGLSGTSAAAAPRTPLQPIPLEMYGHLGGQAVARFELANEQQAPTQVSFLVSPLRGPGPEVFRPIVMIDPQQFRLASGAVQTVTISVALEPGMFVVGHLYSGTVEVIGFPEVSLALTVWAADPPGSDEAFRSAAEADPSDAWESSPPLAVPDPAAPAVVDGAQTVRRSPARARQTTKAAAKGTTAAGKASAGKKAVPRTRTRTRTKSPSGGAASGAKSGAVKKS